MNIETIKIELVQDILRLEDENLLEEVKDFLKKINKTAQPKLYPMSINELNERIDTAEEDFKYGRVTDIDDFLKDLNQRIDNSEDDFRNGRYTDSKDLIRKYSKS